MKNILILLLALSLHLIAADDKKNVDEIDHVSLAALLLRDGHISRAKDELNQVDLKDETIDFVRFYTLKGLVLTKQNSLHEANSAFKKSIEAGQKDKSIYLYIAQNSYKQKKYQETLNAIKNAGKIIEDKVSIYALKAECYWQLKNENKALVVLKESIKRFPKEYSFYKQRFNYLVTLKLYQSALNDANTYLAHAKTNEKTSIAFIATLRKSGETDRAILLAEKANLEFINSAEITVLLAHLYIDKEMIQAAADLFDQASIEDSKYLKESAEMMRRAKEFVLALFKNSQMLNSKDKLKQRVAIYLEYGAYERIAVSYKALKRTSLIEDETIRYALAYSYYKTGDFKASERELKKLKDPELFQKATEIRKNIQKCTKNYWECDL